VLDDKKKPTQQLKKRLKPLAAEYDFIFLDCPPNITLLSEAVFSAADVLLSPIIPTTLSLRTLAQLKNSSPIRLGKLIVAAVFFMADRRTKTAQGHHAKRKR